MFFLADPFFGGDASRGGTSAPNFFGGHGRSKGPTSPTQNLRKWILQTGEFFRNMYLRFPEDSIILGIYLDVPGRKLGSMVRINLIGILASWFMKESPYNCVI